MFVVFSYSRLRKPMVGAWVWVWWWWGFRDHGFVVTDSYWRIREHTNNYTKTRNNPWRVSGFVVSSYSRLRKPMVGAWVWVW